jgi:hypothetical protein
MGRAVRVTHFFAFAPILLALGCGDTDSTAQGRTPTAQGRITGTGSNGLRVREEPTASSSGIGTLAEGETILIYCQVDGESVSGNSAWDLIQWNGHDGYVADAHVEKNATYGFSRSIARCDDSNGSIGNGDIRSGTVDIDGPAVRSNVQAFANAACGTLGACEVSTYSGHEPSADLALDFLVSNEFGRTPTDNYAFGNRLADFALANRAKYGVDYVIFRQRINQDGRGWRSMEDRGSITQNHYDHVHVSFDP